MKRLSTRRAAIAVAVATVAVGTAAVAQAKWSTISDEAYNGGLVCRDGMTFEWGIYTSDTSHVPPPQPPSQSRLVVTWAAVDVPDGQPTTTPSPDPLPAGSFPQVAYDHHIHADYNPELIPFGGSPLYLINQSQFQI